MSGRGIRLYDPTAEPRAVAATLAPRLTSLAGTRIGILDNGKANAGTLMLAVTRILQQRYGVGEIVKRDKPVAGPPSPEALAALSQCDFALVGSADCGSCTSWSIHGSIMLEQRGVPTATMGTFEFEALARLEAANRGIADLPLALVPHPLGGIHEDEVIRKADLALEAVLKAVTRA